MLDTPSLQDALRQASAVFAISCALYAIYKQSHKQLSEKIPSALLAGGSGAAIPNTLVMITAPFYPDLYVKLPDLTIMAAIGAVVLIAVIVHEIRKLTARAEQHAQSPQYSDQKAS